MPLQILIYFALAMFVIVNLVRLIRIAAMPVHLRWELYPVPHEPADKVKYGGSYLEETDWWTKSIHTNRFGELKIMVPEILFLKGIWEHNRKLWLWSWLLHLGLYFLIGVAVLAILGSILQLAGVSAASGSNPGVGSGLFYLMRVLYWTAVVAGSIGSIGVLMMRLFHPRLKGYTSIGAVFNLLFILAIFITGLASLVVHKGMVGETLSLARGLLTFGTVEMSRPIATAHIAIIALFMLYFPFTHMTHMFAKYFTYHSIRWDDSPTRTGGKIEKRISRYLAYPVRWSAPHIRGDGRKTWLDVVKERGFADGEK